MNTNGEGGMKSMINELVKLRPNPGQSYKEVPGVVCPNCFKPLKYFSMFGPDLDGYGRNLRSYIGHCCACDSDCEVLQFESSGVWCMAGFRRGDGWWHEMQQLPDPPAAAVATGPGGDFVRPISDEQLEAILEKATRSLVDLGKIIATVRDLMRNKIHHEGHEEPRRI